MLGKSASFVLIGVNGGHGERGAKNRHGAQKWVAARAGDGYHITHVNS
jgi:hypothetical protein